MNVNVLNATQALDTLTELAKGQPTNIAEWILSTYLRWTKSLPSGHLRQCISERRANDPVLFLASGRPRKSFDAHLSTYRQVDPDKLEPWALKALRRNELYFWKGYKPDDFNHWLDFMRTLPERQIKYTVPDLIKAVEVWDGTFRRRKLEASLTEGVELVADGTCAGHDVILVRLQTKTAYDAEAAVMTNCVDTYFKRIASEGTYVYSLRNPEQTTSLASIEVNAGRVVVQIEGPERKAISLDYFKCAMELCAKLGIQFKRGLTNGNTGLALNDDGTGFIDTGSEYLEGDPDWGDPDPYLRSDCDDDPPPTANFRENRQFLPVSDSCLRNRLNSLRRNDN